MRSRFGKTLTLMVLATAMLLAASIAAGGSPRQPWVSASWPLQEGKGETALDGSGHENHGRIRGNRQKTAKIQEAYDMNEAVLRSTFQSLASAIRSQRQEAIRILAFNPLSWDRKDLVTCTLPVPEDKAAQITIVDGANRAVPHQLVGGGSGSAEPGKVDVVFLAEVPALGYATYYLAWDAAAPRPADPFQIDLKTNRFENRFYRIEVDGATGAIKSIGGPAG